MFSKHPKPVHTPTIRLDPDKVRMLSDTQLAARIEMLRPVLQGVSDADPAVRLAFRAAVTGIGNGEIKDYAKALKGLKNEQRRRDRERGQLQSIPWTDFQIAIVDNAQFFTSAADERFAKLGAASTPPVSADTIRQVYLEGHARQKVYVNSRYTVFVDSSFASDGEGGVIEMVHLSIKRNDQQTIHDWRDMQRIKNELVGPECEGVELYPAESRCVDTANQYHLWCVKSDTFRWEIGWNTPSLKIDEGVEGVGQRPFEA
jgi:hypothetical protein